MSTLWIVFAGALIAAIIIQIIATLRGGVSVWVALAVIAVVAAACWAAIGWMRGGVQWLN